MPLTYEQSAQLMQNGVFMGRVKVSCLKFADYIVGEAASTPAHSTRIRWAQNTFVNPDSSAQQVTPPVVMDAAVQAAGIDTDGDSTIDDAALQSAVESTINKML